MKKLLKIILVLAVLAVILLIAAVITLRIMFPPEKLKAMAQQYAQQTLNREVTFSDVSLNLIGVTLDDFAVSEPTTFDNGTFVKADKAVVKIALKPLFKKRIEISTVGLEGLDVNVSKNKDGQFNFADLIPASSEETPAQTEETSSSASGFSLMAQRIYATDCNFYYKDAQSGMDASLTNVNLEITGFNLDEAFDVALSFTTDYQDAAGLAVTVPFDMQLQANLAGMDLEKAQAVLKSLTMNYKNILFSVSGSAKNFNAPVVDLTGKVSGVSNTALSDILPDLPAFVLPDINFAASAEANMETSSAVIKQARLSLSDSAVTVAGNAGWGGAAPTYNMSADINVNLQQVAQMAEMLSGYSIGGSITGSLKATDKNDGQDVSGTINLNKLTLQYDPLTMSNLTGSIVIKSLADISCNSLTGLLNNEKFTTSFAYKDLGGVLDLVFNFDLDKLTLDRFPTVGSSTETDAAAQSSTSLASSGPETLFNVRANLSVGEITMPFFTTQGVSLNANLTKASATMKNASGSVSFNLKEGAITDLDQFVRGNRIVKIIMLPLTLIKNVGDKLGVEIFPAQNNEDKGKIKFSSGSGTYNFVNGLMTVKETHFDSAVSNVEASGNINFKSEALDMRVSATLLSSTTPIVFKIGGSMTEPSGKLDVAGTATSLVKGFLSGQMSSDGKNTKEAAQAAKEQAKAKAEETKAAAEQAAANAKQAVEEKVNAAADALKGIGSLFKK